MKNLRLILLVLVLALFSGLWGEDLKFPRVSPGAEVSQTIGLTDVKIVYHRPGVKGRVIWGELVPYDKVWRTGANEATTIEFSSDVMIGDNKLAAGTYGLFTIPGKDEWTIIFSKQNKIWGAMGYKEEQDALRVKVKPASAPHCEWMQFQFVDLHEGSAKVNLHWEKIMVSFTIKVDTRGALVKNIEKTLDSYWLTPYYAANYAYHNEMIDKAKEWVKSSLSIEKNYFNMLLKAQIHKKLAKTKKETREAIKILEEALKLSETLPKHQQGYVKTGKALLEEWTGKTKK
jgi:hypothetical protein